MSSELSFMRQKLKLVINIYAVSKKGVSWRKQGVSWTKIAFLFKCSQFSCLLLHLVQKAKFPCSKKVRAIRRSLFCFVSLYGGSMRGSQNLEIVVFFSEKKNIIWHLARFNFSRLSLASILKYYPVLHAVKR